MIRYCPKCAGSLLGNEHPCHCKGHSPDTLAECLREVSETMKRMARLMRDAGKIGATDHEAILHQHADEMDGAASMCVDWAENLDQCR